MAELINAKATPSARPRTMPSSSVSAPVPSASSAMTIVVTSQPTTAGVRTVTRPGVSSLSVSVSTLAARAQAPLRGGTEYQTALNPNHARVATAIAAQFNWEKKSVIMCAPLSDRVDKRLEQVAKRDDPEEPS